MQDVARLAGVSHQTVSRVLNDHPRVAPETRARVLAAIAEVGYRRNSAARALVTSRSGTIGLLTPRSLLYGPVSTLISVEEAARTAGLFVSVASLFHYDAASVAAALDHFLDQGVEGVIVIAPVPEAVQEAASLAARVPMVLIAADTPSREGIPTASVDQELGARLATRHLVGLGHRDIAHVSGLTGWLDATARLRGWRQELAAAELPVRPPLEGGWTAEGGFRAGRELLLQGLPTAVFAANDLMALGLLRAFTEAGLRVPEDVSVVGFDDVEGAAHYLPPLTTVRQDFAALGERCVELLLGQLAHEQVPATALMAPELIVRASTSRPAKRLANGSGDGADGAC
jgi:DNA-binding LacI/PurR family transcriptional regulator